MYQSHMFEEAPEGFRLATDDPIEKKLIALTIAQAFAECEYPVPATNAPYSVRFKFNFEGCESWVGNALEYGTILTNEDYSAVMLITPINHRTELDLDKLANHMREYGTDEDAESMLAIFSYIFEDEQTLTFSDNAVYIEVLAVQPPRQGKKEASRLIRNLFKEAAKENREIWLFTNTEKNESIYNHFGFETVYTHNVPELNSTSYYMRYPAGGIQ